MKQTFYFILIMAALISCSDSKHSSLIIGNWQGVEWLVNGASSTNNAKGTLFTFKANSEYIYDYSGTIEKGNYKILDDKLYTTPNDQQEMMVRIAKLTPDSLVFDMNRGGQPETLILLRKKQ
jgi:hypothetical protein